MGDFFCTDNALYRGHTKFLPDGAVTVYQYLASRADRSGECWPSVTMMADELGRSRPAVRTNLRRLLEYGLVVALGGAPALFRVVPASEVPLGGVTAEKESCRERQESFQNREESFQSGGKKVSTSGNKVATVAALNGAEGGDNLAESGNFLSTDAPSENGFGGNNLSPDWKESFHKQDSVNQTQDDEAPPASEPHRRTVVFDEPFPEPPDEPEPEPASIALSVSAASPANKPPTAKPPRRLPPRALTPEAAAKQAVCAAYIDGFQARHGQRPVFTRADAGILKNALAAVKVALEGDWEQARDELCRVLTAFFADEFLATRGHVLNLLPSRINALRGIGATHERNGNPAGLPASGLPANGLPAAAARGSARPATPGRRPVAPEEIERRRRLIASWTGNGPALYPTIGTDGGPAFAGWDA